MSKTRFLIACQPRTGSNWLCTLLQSHPQILCHHEVFHPDEIYYAFGHRDGRLAHLGGTAERDRDPQRFLDALWRADFGRAVVGIKLLDGQAPEVLAALLADAGVRKLILRRRSRLRAYVSLLRARETGKWARSAYDGLSVEVAPQALADFARRYDAYYARLRAATAAQPALEIVYEELERDPRQLERVLEFLGVEAGQPLAARTEKQSRDSLREAIRNHAELERALRGSELEREFDESPSEARAGGSAA